MKALFLTLLLLTSNYSLADEPSESHTTLRDLGGLAMDTNQEVNEELNINVDTEFMEMTFDKYFDAAKLVCGCMCRYNSSNGRAYRHYAPGLYSAELACGLAKAACEVESRGCRYGNHQCGCQ